MSSMGRFERAGARSGFEKRSRQALLTHPPKHLKKQTRGTHVRKRTREAASTSALMTRCLQIPRKRESGIEESDADSGIDQAASRSALEKR